MNDVNLFYYPVHWKSQNKIWFAWRILYKFNTSLFRPYFLIHFEFIHKQILGNEIIFKLIHEQSISAFLHEYIIIEWNFLLWIHFSMPENLLTFGMRCNKSSKNVNNLNTYINNKNNMEIFLWLCILTCEYTFVHGDD